MATHTRMEIELEIEELSKELLRLKSFLVSELRANGIKYTMTLLILRQVAAMDTYREILKERLEIWSDA